MHAAIQKQGLTPEQKTAQSNLIETMTLNTLLTGLDPKLGAIIRASNPQNILQATFRIKRELQLQYFESQKFPKNHPLNNSQRRPPQNVNMLKSCSICKRTGHIASECRTKQQHNYTPNFQPNFYQSPQARPSFTPNQNFQRPQFNSQSQYRPQTNFPQNPQNRPPAVRPNPNFNQNQQRPNFTNNQQRPSVIKPNPNFNHRTHHVNDISYDPYYQNYQNYGYENNFETYQNYYEDQNLHQFQDYNYDYTNYQNNDFDNTAYQNFDNQNYYNDDTVHHYNYEPTHQNTEYQDFQLDSQNDHPPIHQSPQISQITSQLQEMSVNTTNKSQTNKEQCFL